MYPYRSTNNKAPRVHRQRHVCTYTARVANSCLPGHIRELPPMVRSARWANTAGARFSRRLAAVLHLPAPLPRLLRSSNKHSTGNFIAGLRQVLYSTVLYCTIPCFTGSISNILEYHHCRRFFFFFWSLLFLPVFRMPTHLFNNSASLFSWTPFLCSLNAFPHHQKIPDPLYLVELPQPPPPPGLS